MKERFWRLLPLPILAVIDYAMQIGPHDAQTNLCQWVQLALPVSNTCLDGHMGAMWTIVGAVGTGSVAWFFWPDAGAERSPHAVPDMHLADAINYIVNDSTADLRQPPAPHIAEYGPAKGQLVRYGGVPHNDARQKIQEKLISGEIEAWGKRERSLGTPLPSFDDILRRIPKEYWDHADLGWLTAFHNTKNVAQTQVRATKSDYSYSELMLNRAQVMRTWPRKPFVTRTFNQFRNVRRVDYWNRELDRRYRIIDPMQSRWTAKAADDIEVKPSGLEWKSIADAVETFADPDDLKGRDGALEWITEAPSRRAKAERALENERMSINSGVPVSEEAKRRIDVATRQLHLAEMMERDGPGDLRFYWQQIRKTIQTRLEVGELVAKGFKAPHVAGTAEVAIPAAEWRFLEIDPTNGRAIGGGVEYIGVKMAKEMT